MTKKEIKQARAELAEFAETTTTIIDGKGQALCIYWTGGQKIFYSLDRIQQWVMDMQR